MSDPEIGWDDLSAPLRDRVDAALRSRQTLAALTMLCQEEIGPRLGLVQGQGIVAARYALLTDRDEVEADSAVNLERLNARVDAIPDSTVAIEALWDGDTDGWLVALVAVVERPGRQHARFDDVSLALIRSGTDLRVFNGNVPPWP